MQKHKPDLSRLTINQLCQLTGRGYRTVKKRLADLAPVEVTGNAQLYNPRDALPAIFLGEADADGESLDLSQERAALARSQRLRTETETKLKQAQLDGVLAGGVVAADRVIEFLRACESHIVTEIQALVARTPAQILDPDHHAALRDTRGEKHRLHVILEEETWQLRLRLVSGWSAYARKYLKADYRPLDDDTAQEGATDGAA